MFACRDETRCCHGYCLPGYRLCVYGGVEMNSAARQEAGPMSYGDPLMSVALSQCRMVSQLLWLKQRPTSRGQRLETRDREG